MIKPLNAALLGAALGALLVSLYRPVPQTSERVVYKDRVVEVEKEVVKTKVIKETRPDGTKIVTREETQSQQTTREKEKTAERKSVAPVLPRYSVGVSTRYEDLLPLRRVYQVDFGYRIGQSPFWLTAGFNSDKALLLGARMEW